MARGRPFEVIDVDSHAYEPESIWSDYVDDGRARGRAPGLLAPG